ncbi:hypothetical protein GRX03_15590 [Halovenus sp. WSH3]|uniref:Uncharacterized protein n=1 Tax=Halovenus carboxidivorans TaxID=2692199 RepID=A0A6B0TCR3_9EURY|nr:hypothetical protein [Halovenus carboxidivorans]MXR53021.1 hypothetical protein [Halovenus carboxidivorans]
MSDESGTTPSNTIGNRIGISRVKSAVLFRANRFAVTAGFALAIFLAFVLVTTLFESLFLQQLSGGDMIDTMFATMLSVVLTGTTLVVSIGQLVLAQETGPLGDQRERMDNAMEFREFTEDLTGRPSPADPGDFLAALVDATATKSTTLRDELSLPRSTDAHDEIRSFADGVVENAAEVSSALAGAEFGTFDVLSAALDFNYGWKIARIEHLEAEYGERLSDGDIARFEDLKTALSMFGPAREHVKTLYFQWGLIDLSQMILYAAIPATVVAGLMIAVVGPATAPGATLGVEHITLVVGAALSVTLLPFLLFASYLFRILSVAKRTLAIEPLVLRE